MSIEPFVYLAVFLLLTGLLFLTRWLNENLRKEIDLKDLFGPSERPREPRRSETVEPKGTPRAEPLPPPSRAPGTRHRHPRWRLPIHNKRDLRQGIILMTVLGPCRALDSRSSTSFIP